MARVPKVSVLIPTFKSAHLIGYVLEGLRNQSYPNYEVVVIMKPSGDGTEEVVKRYRKKINIELVLQNKGYFVDALNIGLENATGDIIAFLDDDAIPLLGWMQSHVGSYTDTNVGGVAGNVIPTILKENKPVPVFGKRSEVIPSFSPFASPIGAKIWSCPLPGLENHLVYLSKAGTVEYDPNLSNRAWRQTVKSLLGMGANMSVLSEALKDFKFPKSWILGLTCEQFIGWHVWRKGYNLIFNPKAEVYHLEHGQTLSRNIRDSKRERLRWIERDLLFYRLYDIEKNLSKMHRISWRIFSTADNIKKICWNRETDRIIRMKASFNSELIGLKWLLSRKLRGYYSPLTDLEKYVK